jgi:AraC-like DNA-binding protein
MSKRAPVVYNPCIYIVVQGKKTAYLGNEAYVYDALNYLVLSVPLPLECQIIEATKEQPYLAVRIDIDTLMLNELIQETDNRNYLKTENNRGIFATPLEDKIRSTLSRILSYLAKPSDAAVLGKLAMKELLFYVLQGEQGEQLKTFAYRDRHNFKIARVINFIQDHYAQTLEIAELADKANMSQSSFHQHFKAVTNSTPIQYIKTIRLHAARRNMLYDHQSASDAAYQVGYASPSQFSREYRRLFGITPSTDAKLFEVSA